MRTGQVVPLVVAAFSLAACAAYAQTSAPPPAPVDAQGLVDARKGGMAMSVAALAAISAGVEKKVSAKSYALPARGMANFAESLPALFDARTAGIAGSKAAPAIWSDAEGFAAKVSEYRDATAALSAAIAADDADGIATALASTKAACKACHDTYQLK